MCGRYAFKIHRQFDQLDSLSIENWPKEDRYNIAPTQSVPVVRTVNGRRIADQIRWGLIPPSARGKPGSQAMVNARVETFKTSPAYREPWIRGQRCLQIASGFYEWHQGDGRRSPFFIHITDQPQFAIAALWDRSVEPDGRAQDSCVMITLPANKLMHHIHNTGRNPSRMPAILEREDWETWLTGWPEEAAAVLKPYPDDRMGIWEVSPRVNSAHSQGQELIAPTS